MLPTESEKVLFFVGSEAPVRDRKSKILVKLGDGFLMRLRGQFAVDGLAPRRIEQFHSRLRQIAGGFVQA